MELIKKEEYLPTTIEELQKYIVIGKERLKARRAQIRAYDKLEAAETTKKAILEDAQNEAESLLDAEAKLGELLEDIKPKYVGSIEGTHVPKQEKSLPPNITKKESHYAQTISRNPEVVEKIKTNARAAGILPTTAEVVKEVLREKKAKDNEELKNQPVKPFEKDKYNVIIVDPPWPMKKIVRDVRPNQTSEIDYPVMEIEEIKKLSIPTAENTHLFLWATHKFLPVAFEIIEEWNFKYICCMVWHKPGGFQPIGLPQYNNEFCLYAKKGTPKFIDTKSFPTCFCADRGAHSEKPEEFYQTIKRVTSGNRLDMFSRRKIDGFDAWGNQA